MSNPSPSAWSRRAVARDAGIVIALAALIGLLHGRSVGYGLFMDDYAHFKQLRECDWSPAGLTAACRLELVGGVIDLWWLPQCTLRFFRPVAFGIMKATYTLFGWEPAALHVASLAWHCAATVLLMALLRKFGASPFMAAAVAALFAIHPGHIATVQWIACQTELMVTSLLLAATLCFWSFRGQRSASNSREARPQASSRWWLAASVGFFALALGCRENALAFPLVMLALEPQLARCRRRTVAGYVCLAAVSLVYFGLRWSYLQGAALPPRPYVIPPGAPDFVPFVFNKFLYYLLGEFLLMPVVPIAGLDYIRQHPAAFYSLSIVVVVGILLLAVSDRRDKTVLFAFAWLACFMAPVLPAFESPHHLYLPGVGWAIIVMLLLRRFGGWHLPDIRRARVRSRAAWCGIALLGIGFASATHFFGLALDTAQQVEDRVVDEVVSCPGGVRNGDTLYLANLPMIAHYVALAVEQRTGTAGLRAVALTWAPRVLGMHTPAELTWTSPRTIEMEIAGDRYFSGPIGRLVEEASVNGNPTHSADPIHHRDFEIRLLKRDADGVSRLRFEFVTNPCGPGVHLFWGSRARWAFSSSP